MIQIKNLSVSFGTKKVFDNFSLTADGPFTCIMGESGCGKSTLLRVIAGLQKPDGGVILNAPQKPAVMFQEDRLFPWLTAAENVEAVCTNKNEAEKWLDAVELSEEKTRRPAELSGGQCRRVALARTLAADSDCLILDEPFTGMDPELTKRMIALLRKSKVPVIFTTHNKAEAEELNAKILPLLCKQNIV